MSKEEIKAAFISLGCDKNRVDTEEIMGALQEHRISITGRMDEASVIVVNTCSFIGEARSEAVETILEAAQFKKAGKCRLLVATGCMAQMYKEELLREVPEIDLVVGISSYPRLPGLIKKALNHKFRVCIHGTHAEDKLTPQKRIITTPSYSVYVKIAEGCSNRCNYCVIPGLRGDFREKPMVSVFNETKKLVQDGAREINLIAQDTTFYGIPENGKSRLPELLQLLSKIKELKWIRVLYAHPSHLDDRVINTISKNPRVCSYIDLPLQHVNTEILKSMGRFYSKKDIINTFKKIKEAGLTLRTTFMVGFPGEKEEHFRELVSFIKKYPFGRMGAFTYSPEKGTPAFYYRYKVPHKIKIKRWEHLMKTQRKISYIINQKERGKIYPVMIESRVTSESGYQYRGRTPLQAPEVDGCTYFTSPYYYRHGDMVDVMVTHCSAYDLYGRTL